MNESPQTHEEMQNFYLEQCTALSPWDKMPIALVLEDLKPACEITLMSQLDPALPEAKDAFRQDIDDVEDMLRSLDLEYVVRQEAATIDEDDMPWPEQTIFYASKDRTLAEELARASDPRDDLRRGEILGIPETARAAFGSEGQLDHDTYMSMLADDPDLAIAGFAYSKDHFDDESAIARERADAMRRKYSGLYEKARRSIIEATRRTTH